MRRFPLPSGVLSVILAAIRVAIPLVIPFTLPWVVFSGAVLFGMVFPGAARAERASIPAGLIVGPGLSAPGARPGLAAPPSAAVPVGPFWQMAPLPVPAGRVRVAPFSAMAGPGLQCRQAIAAAERGEGIPPRLLQAIGLVESGRQVAAGGTMLPWPWTIDVEGRGAFYPDAAQAIAAVRAAQATGARSIDVGCLQVNLLHHPHAFASLAEAFDPAANARYAAAFLRRLFAATHDWAAAAAAYHSQTPALAGPYRAQVMAAWARLGGPAGGGTVVASGGAGGAASPFAPVTPLAMAPPRLAAGFRIIRSGPAGGAAPPGRSLAAYRSQPIPFDRGG